MKYQDFAHLIDMDALYDAIGFNLVDSRDGNDRGYCIFPENHTNGDTTGKLSIHREKRVWNCWVCGGGNLIQLVERTGKTKKEAEDFLYEFTGASVEPDDNWADRMREKLFVSQKKMESLPFFNKKVLDKWTDTEHPWFLERGINAEVARQFQIAYTDEAVWFGSERHYTAPGIILPHFWKDELVGWQIRWVGDRPKWLPKYVNTDDLPRETTLWGYDYCLEHAEDVAPIVVESVPSALALISHGYPAIATFGANVTEAQAKLLRAFSESGVRLAPDNDMAGLRGYARLADRVLPFVDVQWLTPYFIEVGGDIGDLAKTPELLSNCIEQEDKWPSENTKKWSEWR